MCRLYSGEFHINWHSHGQRDTVTLHFLNYMLNIYGLPKEHSVKNPLANARDAGDMGLIPGLGRSPGVEMAIYSSILAWKTWR